MNEQYVKWLNSKDHGIWPTTREYEFGEKAFIAGLESAKPEKRFGNKQREKWWAENKGSLFSADKMDFNKIWKAAIESIDDEVYNRAVMDCAKCLEQNGTCIHAIALSNCRFWRKLEGAK